MPSAPQHPIVRLRWAVLAAFVALCAWLIPGVANIQHDDDVLAFLPPDHEDVQSFQEVAGRFGMLEVVLVGLETPDEQDLLTEDRIESIRALATNLGEVSGVRMVLSFVDLPDPKVVGDGLEVAALVPEGKSGAPDTRERVLGSRDAVGNLISADGRAAALLVYLVHVEGPGRADSRRRVLGEIREVTRAGWDGASFFGGAPYAEFEAAEASRGDIEKLSPIVVGVLALASAVLLMSLGAALINLAVAGLAVGLVMGAHGVFGEPLTIVSSTIPVMMVALGGAFGVHMLAGYQRQSGTPAERASATVRELWLPVTLSGLTTSVAFFALMVMPQVPMQRFGMAAGMGVLILLVLAIGVVPALLAALPARVLPTSAERGMPLTFKPPVVVLLLIALGGAGVGLGLRADPDVNNVFDEGSEPRRANAFFDDHFGGSTFLQVAVEAELGEPVVLREIRDLAEEVRTWEGVVDVRSLMEPVEVLNEALGGRRGVPETPGRASRVLTYLADHPAMAQLLTPDRRAAIIHVKLAPLDGDAQVELTRRVRERMAAMSVEGLVKVGAAAEPAVAAARQEQVRVRVGRLLGKEVAVDEFAALAGEGEADPDLIARMEELRDKALDSEDSPVEGVPRVEIDSIAPESLLTPRGDALQALLREHLPTLVAEDPEGVRFVTEHLGPWIDEEIGFWRVERRCRALGLPPEPRPTEPEMPMPGEESAEGAVPASGPPGPCRQVSGSLSELEDDEWAVPPGVDVPALRELSLVPRLTGQPVLGQAFADSVTENLRDSTIVSLVGLALMLAISGHIVALIPALWTLALTAGLLHVLGQPISIGTSMVACIALGAGVDFAIHLNVRARALGGPDGGARAVDQLGIVVMISGVTLGLAFLVLLASDMPPLRQFGTGLAIGLVGAALGAVWWIPRLARPRRD